MPEFPAITARQFQLVFINCPQWSTVFIMNARQDLKLYRTNPPSGNIAIILTLALALVTFSTSGCSTTQSGPVALNKPGGIGLAQLPPGGNDIFNKAWLDGCETGLAEYGHAFHKHFYRPRRDVRFYNIKGKFNGRDITSDDEALYQRTYPLAFFVCRHYILGRLKGGPAGVNMYPKSNAGFGDSLELQSIGAVYETKAWGSSSGNNIAYW